MARATKVLAVGLLTAALISCGGGGGGEGSTEEFCAQAEQARSLQDLDPTNPDDLATMKEVVDDIADVAPDEVSDDIAVLQELVQALIDEDAEKLGDNAFQDKVARAGDSLEAFTEDECGPVGEDTTAAGETSAPGSTDATVPAETTAPGVVTTAPVTTASPVTEAPIAEPLAVTDQGYAVHDAYGDPVGSWAAIITNPNTELVASSIDVQMTAKDAAGAVVDTATGYLNALLPGESRAVGSDYFDTTPNKVATIEVVADAMEFRAPTEADVPRLEIGGITYRPDPDGGARVTAEATSLWDETMESASVTMVFRGAGGAIVGASQGYVNVVPAGGSVGVEVQTSLDLPDDVQVEAYPDYMTDVYPPEVVGEPVTVSESGFRIEGSGEDTSGSWAAVVANPNDALAAQYVSVVATFRDADGVVVDVDWGTISGIPPAGTSAYASDYLWDTAAGSTQMDVVVLAGDFAADPPPGEMTASGVSLRQQDYGGGEVVGELTSTFADRAENVSVSAVFRDKDGTVIGGASGYVEFVPANGSVGFSISTSQTLTPRTQVEVYPGMGDVYDEI